MIGKEAAIELCNSGLNRMRRSQVGYDGSQSKVLIIRN